MLSRQMQEMQRAMTALASGGTAATTITPVRFAPSATRPSGCAFCSDHGHFVRDCPRVEGYLREGKCARNADGKVVLPNGFFVPSAVPGKNLSERFDNYYAQNAAAGSSQQRDSPPHLSGNLFEITHNAVLMHQSATVEEVPDDDEDCDTANEVERLKMLLSAAEKEKKRKAEAKAPKGVRFDGIELPTLKDATRAKTPAVKPLPAVPAPVPTMPAAKPPGVPNSAMKTSAQKKPSDGAPQYKYQTAIEDSGLIQKVLDRSLDSQVSISQRELLALAPDLRKQLKELTTTKRTAVTSANTNLEALLSHQHGQALEQHHLGSTDGAVVAIDSLPLRIIDAVLDDKVEVECILDGGAQFIAIRKDVWERLAIPRRSDLIMVLESANGTKSQTLGVCQNLKLSIGSLDLFFQAQVVDVAPFEVLLGRPFFALTSCQDQNYPNGEQTLTLTDPNADQVITIATRERSTRRRPGEKEMLTTGF